MPINRSLLLLPEAQPHEPFLQRPAPWAPAALRLALGLAGSLFTALALWSLAPPPL